MLLCFYINHKEQNKDTKRKIFVYFLLTTIFSKLTKFCISPAGYPRGPELECVSQGWVRIKRIPLHTVAMVVPYSNTSLNGYHGSTGSLGNMGMIALSSFYNLLLTYLVCTLCSLLFCIFFSDLKRLL